MSEVPQLRFKRCPFCGKELVPMARNKNIGTMNPVDLPTHVHVDNGCLLETVRLNILNIDHRHAWNMRAEEAADE